MKFREKVYRFMQGRNGTDEYARFLSGTGFALMLAALLFTILSTGFAARNETASLTFRILYWLFYLFGLGLVAYSLFRSFSRNVYKRQAENTRFLYQKQRFRRKWSGWKQRMKDRKSYQYFRCPKCRQQLRAPRRKGKIRVTCSQCGEKFVIKT